jgi:two-component system chemotaxis response regulator CheB
VGRIRVLALGATAVTRRELREALAGDEFELLAVVGAHPAALLRVEAAQPDVVVVEQGITGPPWARTVQELAAAATAGVVLAVVGRGADAPRSGAEALSAGAVDWLTREEPADFAASLAARVRECARRTRALASTAVRRAPSLELSSESAPKIRAVRAGRPACVAIGVSTGGPNALAALLPTLPEDFPLPILIVQHMPPVFTHNLASSLQLASRVRVREAVDGDVLEPGLALLAPGDHHMALARRADSVRVVLHQGPQENFCRPAVDVMLRSVAETFGGDVLAVILTGMGQDGLLGVQQLRALGAQVLVQDESSSVVWGMPGAVARAGLADAVLPLPEIAPEILRRVSPQRLAKGA